MLETFKNPVYFIVLSPRNLMYILRFDADLPCFKCSKPCVTSGCDIGQPRLRPRTWTSASSHPIGERAEVILYPLPSVIGCGLLQGLWGACFFGALLAGREKSFSKRWGCWQMEWQPLQAAVINKPQGTGARPPGAC